MAICPLGDTLAVEDGTEGDRITTPTRKGFEKEGESARYSRPGDGRFPHSRSLSSRSYGSRPDGATPSARESGVTGQEERMSHRE